MARILVEEDHFLKIVPVILDLIRMLKAQRDKTMRCTTTAIAT